MKPNYLLGNEGAVVVPGEWAATEAWVAVVERRDPVVGEVPEGWGASSPSLASA